MARRKAAKRKPRKKVDYRCPICGEPFASSRGNRQTCGLPYCQASFLLHPRRGKDAKLKNYTVNAPEAYKRFLTKAEVLKIKDIRWSLADVNNAIAAINPNLLGDWSNWSIYGHVVGTDRRGIKNQAGRDSIWGFLSRKKVFLKARAQTEGVASLVVVRPPGVSVADHIRAEMLGSTDRDTDHMIDHFYAWHCGCGVRHEVIYNKIEDLPAEDGYHNPCPNCGAAPLEVKTWEK